MHKEAAFIKEVEAKIYQLGWVPSLREMSAMLKKDGHRISHVAVKSCYEYLVDFDGMIIDTNSSPKWVINPEFVFN